MRVRVVVQLDELVALRRRCRSRRSSLMMHRARRVGVGDRAGGRDRAADRGVRRRRRG